jgi:MerR family transcriptional regulator/heat shock protein HspR
MMIHPEVNDNLPVYSIGIAAKLLDVHPRTLRIYEDEGLIKPHRQGGKRFYSKKDLAWVCCLRSLIHENNISIEGLKRLLELMPCWKLKNCNEKTRKQCLRYKNPGKKCWEYTKKVCEKSCKNCETFLNDQN